MSGPTPAILFDLDGTLIHSAPDVCHAVNHVFEAEGMAPLTVDQVKGYLGKGARILMEQAVTDNGHRRDAEALDRMTDDFLEFYAAHPVVHSTVFPGVFDVLGSLRDRGAILAICTNKPSVTTAPVLDALELTPWFDTIVCGDQVTDKKPHGGHVLETIAACGGSRNRAVMIGDSENDIDAAIHAGVPSVAVSFGYTNKPVRELGADRVIDSFAELDAALAAIGFAI
ncbi:MAG: phosphoglycolate phosphatase [Rhodospirillales bacterium]